MSYQPSIAEFIASNKRKRDDEVIQLSDLSGDSPVSNEEDEDDTDKEKSNPEPLPKKKKRIALRERAIPMDQGSGLFVLLQGLLC